ncbi:1-aminocyclopropane-1-carboxylate oxidase-like 1, partial [Mucuna pruriens]
MLTTRVPGTGDTSIHPTCFHEELGSHQCDIVEAQAGLRASHNSPNNTLPSFVTCFEYSSNSLAGVDEDPARRKVVVEKTSEASEKWGFFQVVNHGIPISVLEDMKSGVHGFYEQDSKVQRELCMRDPLRPLVYNSNFDLYSSPSANWRDTFYCFMAPRPPKPQDLPSVCRDILLEYSKQVMKLESVLFELLSEALKLNPNYLNDIGAMKDSQLFAIATLPVQNQN